MNKKKASFICFLVWFTGIILLIVADQAAKYWAVSKLKGTSGMTLITGVLELQYLENRGMAFGMLQGKIPLLIALCLLFFCVFLYIYIKIPKTRYYLPLICTALVLAAGAVGNLIDRVFRGYVIDFIYFSLIDFPVFNMADIYVVCSGIFLVFCVCFKYKDESDFRFLNRKN